jgi:hypothetical protein
MHANRSISLVGNAKRQAPEWGGMPVEWIHAIIIIYYYRVRSKLLPITAQILPVFGILFLLLGFNCPD